MESVNGTTKRRPSRRAVATAAAVGRAAGAVRCAVVGGRVKRWMSIGMGCGVPCLSLSLSSIGGELVSQGTPLLGTAALGLCCSVLAVSLSHLAWSIEDITGSSRWQSWALAAAVDLSLVTGELSRISGYESVLVPCVMVAVTVASAVLNCWAFLRAR